MKQEAKQPSALRRLFARCAEKRELIYLILGAVTAAASAALLIYRIATDNANFLQIVTMALMIVGGAVMILLSRRSRALSAKLPQTAGADSPLAVKRRKISERLLPTLILTLAAVVFLCAYDRALTVEAAPQSAVQTGIAYERAEVVSIDDSYYQGQQNLEDVPVGKQIITARILSGSHKDEVYSGIKNDLGIHYGTVLNVGDRVILSFSYTDGELENIVMREYDRSVPVGIVILAFLLITVLVGATVGAKSLIGLGFTILCIFTVLIPLLIDGWPTLPTILLMCTYVTIVEFVLLDGVNKKTACAILGTIAGVLFSMLFSQFSSWILRLNGYLTLDAEPAIEQIKELKLMQDPLSSIRIKDLMIGGIMIAALGAVNDVAMSISSAMNELVAVNPNLTRRELLRSGMNIGRDMVGTMTNTLILAVVGGGFITIIYLTSLRPSLNQLMSTTYFSLEVLQAIASSIGVILAVPLTVIIGMLLFGKHHPKRAKKAR